MSIMPSIKILERGFVSSLLRLIFKPALFKVSWKTISSIVYNFFYIQHRANLNKKRIKITNVDHELDFLIPFTPSHVGIYMSFSQFWVKSQAFLIEAFGRSAYSEIINFIDSIGNLYFLAASVYKQHFSTTTRPNYKSHFLFRLIHLSDPHLMCIPSLHIMVVVFTYIKMRLILRKLNAEKEYEDELNILRQRAVAITDSILFVKQHSINCIAVSLYVMTQLEETIFTAEELEDFIDCIFANESTIQSEIIKQIRIYIRNLYHSFIDDGKYFSDWRIPILNFLRDYKPAEHIPATNKITLGCILLI